MTPPLAPWFKALVYSEVFLQLPFFFVGAYAFLARKNWIRIPAIIYGSFVVATMVPILAALGAHEAPGYAATPLVAFYLPYLLIPAALVGVMAANERPFAAARDGAAGRRGKAKRG
jgi:fructose-specific phosphotransferase system IIC component